MNYADIITNYLNTGLIIISSLTVVFIWVMIKNIHDDLEIREYKKFQLNTSNTVYNSNKLNNTKKESKWTKILTLLKKLLMLQ